MTSTWNGATSGGRFTGSRSASRFSRGTVLVLLMTATACRPLVPKPATKTPSLPMPQEVPGLTIPPGGEFGWPLSGSGEHVVTSPFGVRTVAGIGTSEPHNGVDLQAAPGTHV